MGWLNCVIPWICYQIIPIWQFTEASRSLPSGFQHLYSWDGKLPQLHVIVTLLIITPMFNLLHCYYHVLFVMFLAPSYATEFLFLFTSDCPYYIVSKSCIMYHVVSVSWLEMKNWYCPTWLSYLFPYNLITDENDFISAIADISGELDKSFCCLSDNYLCLLNWMIKIIDLLYAI